MDANPRQSGLRQALDSMVIVESGLERDLALASAATKGYLEAPAIIDRLRAVVAGQREALTAHIGGMSEADIPPIGSAISAVFEPSLYAESDPGGREALALLSALAAAFTKAALGYAALHAVAHRSYDIATADLADRHRRSYLQSIGAVNEAVGDVAVQELQEGGHACRCQCPACGPGVCICWHVHVAAEVTGRAQVTDGIVVRTPRDGSNAERAGLRHGDVILAVDGRQVRTYEDMRDGMGSHAMGEEVTIRVSRATGETEELVVKR